MIVASLGEQHRRQFSRPASWRDQVKDEKCRSWRWSRNWRGGQRLVVRSKVLDCLTLELMHVVCTVVLVLIYPKARDCRWVKWRCPMSYRNAGDRPPIKTDKWVAILSPWWNSATCVWPHHYCGQLFPHARAASHAPPRHRLSQLQSRAGIDC